jgi:UDP-N-acetylmuramate--alanine ligase
LIASAKELYPGKKCTVVFQPHLYTRTRDLAPAFAEVLDMADEVILLPIYPAREQPIKDVSSEMIALQMRSDTTRLYTKEELLNTIRIEPKELLIISGAGDIDLLVEPILEIVRKQT